MILTIKDLIVAESTNVLNVIPFHNIMEGTDGASAFGFSSESIKDTVDDGQVVNAIKTDTLDIRSYLVDSADLSKLAYIERNGGTVNVVATTLDGFLLMDGLLTNHYQFSGTKSHRLLVTRRSTPSGTIGSYAGENLMMVTGWVLNPQVISVSAISASISGSTVTLTRTIAGQETFYPYPNIYFPFEGVSLTWSVNITNIVSIDGPRIEIGFLDKDLNSISSTVASTVSTLGRLNVTAVSPAGTYYVRARVRPGARAIPLNDDSSAVTFNETMLTQGVQSTWIL